MEALLDPPLAFGPMLYSPDCPRCGHPREAHTELIGGIQGTRMHCLVCLDEEGPCR